MRDNDAFRFASVFFDDTRAIDDLEAGVVSAIVVDIVVPERGVVALVATFVVVVVNVVVEVVLVVAVDCVVDLFVNDDVSL